MLKLKDYTSSDIGKEDNDDEGVLYHATDTLYILHHGNLFNDYYGTYTEPPTGNHENNHIAHYYISKPGKII